MQESTANSISSTTTHRGLPIAQASGAAQQDSAAPDTFSEWFECSLCRKRFTLVEYQQHFCHAARIRRAIAEGKPIELTHAPFGEWLLVQDPFTRLKGQLVCRV